MATQTITILLDQSYFPSPIFATKLQKINTIMTTFTLKTINPTYKQYTRIRRQYIHHIQHLTLSPKKTISEAPTTQKQMTHTPKEPQTRHVHFQDQSPDSHTNTTITDTLPNAPTQQRKNPHSEQKPTLSIHLDHSTDINWEEATISTEVTITNKRRTTTIPQQTLRTLVKTNITY